MALRPVSELGLVEVTDVAATATPAPRRRRKPPQQRAPEPHQAPAPANAGEGLGGGAGSRGARLATSVLSGAIGLAGAMLAGRAILRR